MKAKAGDRIVVRAPHQGERDRDGARIVLAGNYETSEMAVRHEMLHHLLDRTGHPPEYFVTRCHLTWDSWNAGEQ